MWISLKWIVLLIIEISLNIWYIYYILIQSVGTQIFWLNNNNNSSIANHQDINLNSSFETMGGWSTFKHFCSMARPSFVKIFKIILISSVVFRWYLILSNYFFQSFQFNQSLVSIKRFVLTRVPFMGRFISLNDEQSVRLFIILNLNKTETDLN
jgi:hypothetical protein